MNEGFENVFDEFVEQARGGSIIPNPPIKIEGRGIQQPPKASLYCQIDPDPIDSADASLQIYIYINGSDTHDGETVDMTQAGGLHSLYFLFSKDTVPEDILMIHPGRECHEAIIAHLVAKKAGYTVTVEEEENKVTFILQLGTGRFLEGTADRSVIAPYFNWS